MVVTPSGNVTCIAVWYLLDPNGLVLIILGEVEKMS